MLSEEARSLLKEISRKLDDIITLLILSNRVELKKIKNEMMKDKIAGAIISKADGTKSYSDLAREIAEEFGVAEITVKKKISDLKSIGVIIGQRKGREVFYQVSTLFE
jgi:DNA-binding transcriptional regulator PaaX